MLVALLAEVLDWQAVDPVAESTWSAFSVLAFVSYFLYTATLAQRIPDRKRARVLRGSAVIISLWLLLQAIPIKFPPLAQMTTTPANVTTLQSSIGYLIAVFSIATLVLIPARVIGWRRRLKRLLVEHVDLESAAKWL